jgi:cytochrome bd-type quinol oxidase subunit 2
MAAAVLPHETGHYALMKAFGFRGVALHYSATTHAHHDAFWSALRAGDAARAARIAPLGQVAAVSLAGLVVSYATIAGCAYLAWRAARDERTARRAPHARAGDEWAHGVHPFVAALGLVSTLRFNLAPSILYDHLVLGERYYSGTDEGLLAATARIPEDVLLALGLALVVAAWALILRGLPPGRRAAAFVLTAAGAALGSFLYAGVLGPRLLP